ncbi:MAG TPA: hypothetical protein VHX44_16440 [Planctomycetota bacterium]|nr:hypothetical protein [Planctomycetota bacterium]
MITADRDLVNHKNEVMACFGDAHVSKLKADRTVPSTGGTEGVVKNPEFAVYNPAAKGAYDQADDATGLTPDDIWTFTGDAAAVTECLKLGGGHAVRAYVK